MAIGAGAFFSILLPLCQPVRLVRREFAHPFLATPTLSVNASVSGLALGYADSVNQGRRPPVPQPFFASLLAAAVLFLGAGPARSEIVLTEAEQVWLAEHPAAAVGMDRAYARSEEHTSELQSLMRNSYAVFCFNKKITKRSQNQ